MKAFACTLSTLTTAVLATALSATTAQAQSIILSPSASTIDVGDTVSVDLKGIGFTDATFGGGYNLSFDPSVVELVSFSIPSRWEFFRSSGLLDAASGTVTDVSFNTFSPIGGDFLTGTAVFRGVSAGFSAIDVKPSELFPFAKAGGDTISVAFNGAGITVSTVPEPDSLALLMVGVLGVAATRVAQGRRTGR